MSSSRKLLGFEFTSLCLIAFLAIANGTAYYDLFGHLASLGIPPACAASWSGPTRPSPWRSTWWRAPSSRCRVRPGPC